MKVLSNITRERAAREVVDPTPATPLTNQPAKRSFNAEQRNLKLLQEEFSLNLPAPDVSDVALLKARDDLERWVNGYPSLYEPLADAKSLYSEEQMQKMPQNLAALIAGFCIKVFGPVRDHIGDDLWNYWTERSYR